VNLHDILGDLETALPILTTLVGHPEIGVLAQRLIAMSETEIARRQSETGKTRSEILAEAAATWDAAKVANDELKQAGH
jgi:hypothetical protein